MAEPCYSERLDRAIDLATRAFRDVRRKGSGVPYLTHLLQVMVYVGEYGGDEDQMIAAVLHDYLEDIDGATESGLEAEFGERVAKLVVGLSDTVVRPKPPWRERKERYIASLKEKPADLKLISCADKLHNAESLHRDFHVIGDALWDRFNPEREETLWYYRAVVAALADNWESPLLTRLAAEVRALHESVGHPYE